MRAALNYKSYENIAGDADPALPRTCISMPSNVECLWVAEASMFDLSTLNLCAAISLGIILRHT